jgi:dTDP-4-amino-4,6-dideoxygalactose transaminase
MRVPMVDLRAQYRSIKREIDAAVAEVFESQVFVGGPKVEALETAIAGYVGAGRALAVASGTDALLLLLKALEVKPGDEVITTAFSFFATAGAIANAGATPVFVDIDPASFNIDVGGIEARITERTRAIVPVHLYGQCAGMDAIRALAGKHGLRVIEDAAQSLGARYKGAMACALGDGAALSFYPTKNLGGAGDGGMVVARDEAIAQRVALLRAHGADTTYYHQVVGTNSRLDVVQAAVLLVKLRHLDRWNEERRARAAYYTARFAEVGEIGMPVESPGNFHVYHQYVIRIPRRDAAREFLKSKGIGSAVFYPVPLHRQECFHHLGYEGDDCPEATRACAEVLALPIYAELTPEQQDAVVDAVKEHLAGK